MEAVKRSEVKEIKLPGRVIQKVVGKNDLVKSQKMTVGFAHYSEESGPMEPHYHAEETVYINSADKGWVKYGPQKDNLNKKLKLETGMILHFDELEWHVFEYEKGGHVDIIFIYGQVDNIRPEQK